MPQSLDDLQLVARETRREAMRQARQDLMLAAVGGKAAGMGEVARARGLVVRERENSIFSDAWLPLALLFLVIGLLAGRNAGFIALGLVLLLIVGVSTLWKNLSLLNVSYERRFDRTRVFPGEPIVMTVVIRNDKGLPLTWLRFRDLLPIAPSGDTPSPAADLLGNYTLQSVYSMQSQERVERAVTLRFFARLLQSARSATSRASSPSLPGREHACIAAHLPRICQESQPATHELFMSCVRQVFHRPYAPAASTDYQPQTVSATRACRGQLREGSSRGHDDGCLPQRGHLCPPPMAST
jgi:hypothetical protein